MISVLLPSRGRPSSLTASVATLRDLAHQPHDIEVLVATDEDDPPTARAARDFGAEVVVSPRYGYDRLHLYVNTLAHRARGEWLLLWNDDARMLTPDWDTRIADAPTGVLWPAHNGSPHLNVFPVAHRSLVEILGHFSLSPHCDSWVQDIATAIGAHHHIDVAVLHDRFDLTGGHDDQTYREAQAGYRTADYHSPEMVELRRRDIALLKERWAA